MRMGLCCRVHGEVVQELREVDAELLCAFAADWSERMVTYGK
jgi:hypothetical protein